MTTYKKVVKDRRSLRTQDDQDSIRIYPNRKHNSLFKRILQVIYYFI